MAKILDGRALAKRLNQDGVRPAAARLSRPPGLAVVLVGEDPASQVYVKRKTLVAERVGFSQQQIHLPADTAQDALLEVVSGLNADGEVDGILVQLPLPAGIDTQMVLDSVDPRKDVDGFHPTNAGRLAQGRPRFVPCTPLGVMRLLEEGGVPLEGRQAVVIGRSDIVGKPMLHLLLSAHCTVTVCHSRTRDLPGVLSGADIVIAAVGRAGLVQGEWIKPGAAVVDVGINRLPGGRLCGDVDFESVAARAGWITPVPGGVGPMTIAMLMENTLKSASLRLA